MDFNDLELRTVTCDIDIEAVNRLAVFMSANGLSVNDVNNLLAQLHFIPLSKLEL